MMKVVPHRSTLFPYTTLFRASCPNRMAETLIDVRNLTRTYHVGDIDIHAMNGVNLTIARGEFVAIVGDRKSTRLNSSHMSISYAVLCLKKKTYQHVN